MHELEESSALLLLKEEPKIVEDKKLLDLPIIKTNFLINFEVDDGKITYKG